MSLYNPESIESKWQEYWMNNRSFVAEQESDKPKYYVLCMFPVPVRFRASCWASIILYRCGYRRTL